MTYLINKHRLYATSSPHIARLVIDELRAAGAKHTEVGFVAKEGFPLEDLPEDYRTDTTDFEPALAKGAALGASTGLAAGLIAALIPPLGITLGGAGLLLLAAAGATVGAWSSALAGSAVQNELGALLDEHVGAGRIVLVIYDRKDLHPVIEEIERRYGEQLIRVEPVAA
jgi:hypothetical protein